MSAYLCGGMTLDEIAKREGISRARVWQIEAAAIKKLQRRVRIDFKRRPEIQCLLSDRSCRSSDPSRTIEDQNREFWARIAPLN